MPFFNSSAIQRAEYDAPSSTLQIWFVESGGPYNYYSVPESIFIGLCNAASKGTYFSNRIRDRHSSRR
ncbi:KTSC domain-containing protein [Methylobacterium goesingense]|uniref:KTSC domain-containing protein n=1 Tax=Methylobacterium goesingense TaxID=243690 RepID=UPI001EE31BD7|nr:KTSC domain-containing protein [Methylobacterium goesingense]